MPILVLKGIDSWYSIHLQETWLTSSYKIMAVILGTLTIVVLTRARPSWTTQNLVIIIIIFYITVDCRPVLFLVWGRSSQCCALDILACFAHYHIIRTFSCVQPQLQVDLQSSPFIFKIFWNRKRKQMSRGRNWQVTCPYFLKKIVFDWNIFLAFAFMITHFLFDCNFLIWIWCSQFIVFFMVFLVYFLR